MFKNFRLFANHLMFFPRKKIDCNSNSIVIKDNCFMSHNACKIKRTLTQFQFKSLFCRKAFAHHSRRFLFHSDKFLCFSHSESFKIAKKNPAVFNSIQIVCVCVRVFLSVFAHKLCEQQNDKYSDLDSSPTDALCEMYSITTFDIQYSGNHLINKPNDRC